MAASFRTPSAWGTLTTTRCDAVAAGSVPGFEQAGGAGLRGGHTCEPSVTTRGAAAQGGQRRSLINGMLPSLDYRRSTFALPLDVVGTTCKVLREINFLVPGRDHRCTTGNAKL